MSETGSDTNGESFEFLERESNGKKPTTSLGLFLFLTPLICLD